MCHYWVVFKLAITLFCTVMLLIYMRTFGQMAGAASDPAVPIGLVRNPSPVVHGILALLLLLVATVLAVYKPFGPTPYGVRTQPRRERPSTAPGAREAPNVVSPWIYVAGAIAIGILMLLVMLHPRRYRFTH
jgi:hypothetical protein